MPQRLTIEMFNSMAGEYWTNRYWTSAPVNDAGATMDAIVAAHRAIMTADSIVTKARIDDAVEDTDNFDTVSYNQAGLLTAAGAALVPLFVTLRIDWDVSGGGRPSRKYLRSAITEAGMTFQGLTGDVLINAQAYIDAVIAAGTIVDPQGNAFVDGVIWPYAQMRQLRRGSKKKSTPSGPTPV